MTPTPNTPTTQAPLTQGPTTGQAPAPAPAPAQSSTLSTILKSIGAVIAGGGMIMLTGMQQGQTVKQAGLQAGVAALTTVLAFLTKSPIS